MLYIFTKSTISAGGSRQRAFNVATFLAKEGFDPKLIVPPIYRTGISRSQARKDYLRTLFSLRSTDTVLLQNPIFSTYFILAICIVKILFRPKLVFDFDDATWVQNPIAPRVMAFFSDKIIVGSHYLLSWPPIKNKPVLLMPNLVDIELAQKYSHSYVAPAPREVVLGWMGGGPESMNNLRLLEPIFKKLSEKKVPCIFRLVGSLGSEELKSFFVSTGLKTEFVDALEWGKEGEIQKANAAFDIGLCPLEQNISNEARCSLKILDYMAAAIPVVISPIGENNHFILDGAEGYLPKSEDEWVERLEALVKDASLRKTMGLKAQEKIKKDYSYQGKIGEYVKFLELDIKLGANSL